MSPFSYITCDFLAVRTPSAAAGRRSQRFVQAERVAAGSMDAPQLPQNLSATATLERQLGHTRAAAVIGVTVPVPVAVADGGVVVVAAAVPLSLLASSPPVAFFSSRSPSP